MTDFTEYVDLAAERLGGAALCASDEFFAPKENLLKPGDAAWRDEYTERGKWMDGWETRRKRVAGHDWCIVRLGLPGIIRGVVVDTAHFKGNFPESCVVEGAGAEAGPWHELLPRTRLEAHTLHDFELWRGAPVTHVRLSIYPDGGVARLRLFGAVDAA